MKTDDAQHIDWWLAICVFESIPVERLKDHGFRGHVYAEERFILVQARNARSAYGKIEKHFREPLLCTNETTGAKLWCRFAGINVLTLIFDPIEDYCEVFWEDHGRILRPKLSRLIKNRSKTIEAAEKYRRRFRQHNPRRGPVSPRKKN